MASHDPSKSREFVPVTRTPHGGIHPASGWLWNSDSTAESPWARKIVLSLDGGGVRGYSSLLILEKLMEKIRSIEAADLLEQRECTSSADYCWMEDPQAREPNYKGMFKDFKPHHYIDYFVGTSTGGALMLGRLQMTVEEAKNQYDVIGNDVFGHRRHLTWKGRLFRNRYSAQRMEEALRTVSVEFGRESGRTTNDMTYRRQTTMKANGKNTQKSNNLPTNGEKGGKKSTADTVALRNCNSHTARTVVVAHGAWEDNQHKHPLLFRSYDHPAPNIASMTPAQARHFQPWAASDLPLWKVGRATSAAPTYFAPMIMGDHEVKDGAVGEANNPVSLAYEEVKQMHWKHEPIMMISIGTGMKPDPEEAGSPSTSPWEHVKDALNTMKGFKEAALNSQTKDNAFRQRVDQSENSINKGLEAKSKEKLLFYRFNVPPQYDITGIKLGEWSGTNGNDTKAILRENTDRYMRDEDSELQRCARKLVAIRRERQKTERWESFALNLVYSCPEGANGNECSKLLFPSRWKLRQHATRIHGFVWQVRCVNAREQPVQGSEWACNWGHCGDHVVTVFDSSADYVDHLQNTHHMVNPEVKDFFWIESWLDRGRKVKPSIVSPQNTMIKNQNPG